MTKFLQELQDLQTFQENATIRIETLGNFCVWRNQKKIDNKEWGRDKTVQLLQYFVSNRQRNALHKEKIMDGLWEDWNDRDFKVALHGINKVLEPERLSRTEPMYILRQGVSYQKLWKNTLLLVTKLLREIIRLQKPPIKLLSIYTKGLIYLTEYSRTGHPRNEKKLNF